ncbi:hypothetical protein [Glutamicibacter ardleyensis]|uniref:hypothetical protein n=1 Tax=Glutamicibacter ardleyensis TaxID=225894 RepID=UPI003FD30392
MADETKLVQLGVRVSEELKKEFAIYALQAGTKQYLITEAALREYMDRHPIS